MDTDTLLKDKKFLAIAVLFILFVAGIIVYGKYSGLLLMFALILFGTLALTWKENHIKIAGLAALLILSIANMAVNPMKFGIDFVGGTRIPVVLEKPVDQNTMGELVDTIKKRTKVLGLTEVNVRAIGDDRIYVEIPNSTEEDITFIESTLSHQGVYLGITDGEIAISGEDIYRSTIYALTGAQLQGGADWGVGFSVNKKGVEQFTNVVEGKAYYPLYMFLDRPSDVIIVLTEDEAKGNAGEDAPVGELTESLRDSLRLENDDIELYVIGKDDLSNITPKTNKTKAYISTDAPEDVRGLLYGSGFEVIEFEPEEMAPVYTPSRQNKMVVESWEAVGLLSSPTLSPEVTDGTSNYRGYIISGSVSGADPAERAKQKDENVKKIESILKGGSLPVQISLGSKTTLPASLGKEFLNLSLIGITAALVVMSLLIGIRYMKVKIILPIIAISITELIILLSLLGSFTIDLAAMAGIIAAIGVGVDAQIVITDELLKKTGQSLMDKMDNAFAIIKMNVIIAIVAMLPLLFSDLVEVIGFAISTILGALLGFLLSRPAYAVIAEKLLGKEE